MRFKSTEFFSREKLPETPVYVFTGEDNFLKQEAVDRIRKERKESEYYSYSGKEKEWTDIRQELMEQTFFQKPRLFRVREVSSWSRSSLADLQTFDFRNLSDTVLVLEGEDLHQKSEWKKMEKNAAFVYFWPLNRRDMFSFLQGKLRQSGVALDYEAFEYLYEMKLGNLGSIYGEIEKILLFIQGKKKIDMKEMEGFFVTGEGNIYALFRHMLSGNIREALKMKEYLLSAGEDAIRLIYFLMSRFRQILLVKEELRKGSDYDRALSAAGVKPRVFWGVERSVEGTEEEKFVSALSICLEKEEELKTGRYSEEVVLENLLFKLKGLFLPCSTGS